MKEYSPKSDLWSKIQQRKDFDSQVKAHSTNLPEKMPKADLWSAIESELDRKAPVIPLWKYGMAAASIALIFALSGIAYFQFGEKEANTILITEVKVPAAELYTVEENMVTETEPALEIAQQNESEKPNSLASQNQSINRETTVPIEIPKLVLADLSIEKTFVSELIIPPTVEQETPKTLHQVSISWSKIKPRMQVRTGFGQQETELGQKHQASSDQTGQLTLEINN